MKIAHVGANKRWTRDDQGRSIMAVSTVLDSDLGLLKAQRRTPPYLDTINLNAGRDFLAETAQYDVVVLHSIFHREDGPGLNSCPEVRQSPLHTPRNWSARLEATGARWLAICTGLPYCLHGYYLDLPSYERVRRDDIDRTMMELYRRVK